MTLKIVTPSSIMKFENVDFLAVKTTIGEMGFINRTAPIIAKLAVDNIRIKKGSTEETYRVIDGFLHCNGNNEVVILTEELIKPEDYDPHKYLGK